MLSVIFIIIALLSFLLFYYGTGKNKRVLLVTALWILVVGVVSYSGYFTNTSVKPPRFLVVMLVSVCLSMFLFKIVNKNNLNINFILAIHALRLPVELVLYELFLLKKVPILMTFEGWNFDILIGITALFLLLYSWCTKSRFSKIFILIWNIVGLIFLTTIVTIAILSSPLPLQQLAFDQPNIAVLQFPFIYLPACIVPIVFVSHLLMIKTYRHN
ncbi:hypothetical protein [Flavobacterium foetidum]|uniref:hypothetical protein n=1 Tax=Flavobacterium foetidum TaxID=2026681 RepID=UPI0010751F13|nr:hypothetical protein [Flavobacterium foetidum]KAF2517054.1 hypothetical protein E0W73_02860 [Flavobacterium foetidum]